MQTIWAHHDQSSKKIHTARLPDYCVARRQLFVTAARKCTKIVSRPKSGSKVRPTSGGSGHGGIVKHRTQVRPLSGKKC